MVDGLPRINPLATGGWIQNSSLNIDYTLFHNGLFLRTEEETIRAVARTYPFPEESVLQSLTTSLHNARPSLVIPTSSPLVAAGAVTQTLQTLSEALLIQAIVAPEDNFDRVWESGIANFMASGGQAVLDERLEKYVEP